MLFLALPLVVWAAWRFQQRGAGPAGLTVSVVAVLAAVHNRGNFASESLLMKMVTLQSFNAGVSFTAFFFAAAVAERRQAFQELYEREHRIAEAFQRSLLPARLPEIPGVELSARYLPAGRDADVGGDWYDVMPLPLGRVGLVVGDVVGHGIAAAAAMAQLRMALRTYASMDTPPAEVLDRLNHLTADLHPDLLATLLFAAYDPSSGEVRFASAGHPPPLVLTKDGLAEFVAGGLGPPAGVSSYVEYVEATFRIETGGALFLYTDGLVERRDAWLDDRLEALRLLAARGVPDLEAACQHMIDNLLSDGVADDVALLAVRPVSLAGERLRLERPAHPSFVPDVRHLLRRWLAENGATAEEASDVLVATTEAHSNAVLHAYRRGGGRIEVDAGMDGGVAVVIVRDFGRWRTPGSRGDEGGRGLPLIRAMMDGMEVLTTPTGTEVRMTRRIRACRPALAEGTGPAAQSAGETAGPRSAAGLVDAFGDAG
jgi:anti-sigma regulatory factor (Ser/Thr protein kinase)